MSEMTNEERDLAGSLRGHLESVGFQVNETNCVEGQVRMTASRGKESIPHLSPVEIEKVTRGRECMISVSAGFGICSLEIGIRPIDREE